MILKIIPFIILFHIGLASDLKVEINPDTIYVGSLVKILVNVLNNDSGEVPIFNDMEEESKSFNVVNKILAKYSVEYTLQLWKEGQVIISPIPVDIKKNNQDIIRLFTDEIQFDVFTNILNSKNELRIIKPMQNIELTSPIIKGLFLIVLIVGGAIAVYLLKMKTGYLNPKYYQGTYNKSTLQESIKQIQELPLPDKITTKTTEEYYLALSQICRLFIKKEFYIKATEMTSGELAEHFKSLNFNSELVNSWTKVCSIADMAKYAKQIPNLDQFNKDKTNYIDLIKSFRKIKDYPNQSALT